jgi:hypothetical protein
MKHRDQLRDHEPDLLCADDSSRDYVKKTGVDGKVTWVFDKEHVARQCLKIKALKWIMARMAPRKYGSQ